ncbi:hypothetical protein ST21_041 [Aeromonas phage ST21]|uniref:Uncharacterized protein n=1 Tax=Aeromonas phage ST21 TaxID=3065691 RepID=A0AA96J6T3_9CAUD|nr:hypothetical protein ST21_041 [Aeromonas phage ST21]
MEGCQLQSVEYVQPAGKLCLIGEEAATRMFSAYFPEAHSTLSQREFVLGAFEAVVHTERYEGYLFDLASNHDTPVAVCVMAKEVDLHRGAVVVPLVCYIRPEYRKNKRILSWLSSRQRNAALDLNCGCIMRMKHLNDNTRLITYKDL